MNNETSDNENTEHIDHQMASPSKIQAQSTPVNT